MTRDDLVLALAHPNVQAFLAVIREGETNQTDTAYRMMFGGELFDAPPWQHPRRAITRNGITSTAAGAPQFLAKTWDGLVAQYGFEDFSPAMQDLGAIALIAGRKALDAVKGGRLDEALRLCAREWASLPGSPYGQPTLSKAKALAIFQQYGGTLAGNPTAATPQPKAEVKPMGILGAIIPMLINAAPDLIRLFGGGEQSQKNAAIAEKVAQVAVEVTGAVNEQAAAEKIASDPAAAAAFKQAVSENFDQWMGMVVKFAELEEGSRAKAREFAITYGTNPVLWSFTFPQLLSLLMFIFSAVAGTLMVIFGGLGDELKAAIVTLMIIGGYNKIGDFWFGSSMGSRVKDQPK